MDCRQTHYLGLEHEENRPEFGLVELWTGCFGDLVSNGGLSDVAAPQRSLTFADSWPYSGGAIPAVSCQVRLH